MPAFTVPLDELTRATLEYSGEWGVQHARRLMHLVSLLGDGMTYDADIVALAAYLHDWGGYPAWMQQGVEHFVRSGEVAREWLAAREFPAEVIDHVVECIINHHGGPAGRSLESRLFTDADALELLGVVGVCRTFAMGGRDLGYGLRLLEKYRAWSIAAVSLDVSRPLLEARLREMDEIVAQFQAETFGMI